MTKRYNAQGRDCPICFRRASLLVARDDATGRVLECGDRTERAFERVGGCLARFRLDGDSLVRLEPAPVRELTHAELDRARGGTA